MCDYSATPGRKATNDEPTERALAAMPISKRLLALSGLFALKENGRRVGDPTRLIGDAMDHLPSESQWREARTFASQLRRASPDRIQVQAGCAGSLQFVVEPVHPE